MPPLPSHISRYEVHDRLGEGGMGILYLAHDPFLARTVAIKVLSGHNEELRERFSREARSAASLKHNHIVTIYDVGEDHGRPFIAMEYLDGETLAELIRRRAQLEVTRKLQLMLELCDGLGFAHRRGIIHRDIKPANLMVTSDGILKILDFGLARLTTEGSYAGLTRVGVLIGTPHYMSPEAVEGRPIDHRADIFSVGLVLYELLTYRKAFPGDAPHVVLHSIVTKEPQPLRELYPAIDHDLERVVNKAILKDPDKRYDRLEALAADLARIHTRLLALSTENTLEVKTPPKGREPRSAEAPNKTPQPGAEDFFKNAAKRRAAQLEQYLERAKQRFDERDFDAAIEQCELAAVLDPHDSRVLALLATVNEAIEERQIGGWLRDAEECLSRGAFSQAEELVYQALKLRPERADAQRLQRDVTNRRREHERLVERARSVQAALGRARVNFKAGAFEAAARSAAEALAYDGTNDEAQRIKQEALAAIEQQRYEREREHIANELVALARRLMAEGKGREALDRLCAFEPPHFVVDAAIEELSAQFEELERQRLEEEEARRRRELEEEQRRKEAERLARERAAARRRQEEDEQRRRQAEAQQRRHAADAQRSKARAHLERQEYAAATAAASEAASLVPDHPETLALLAEIANSEREVTRVARIEREVESNLKEAAAALAREQLTQAVQLIERAALLAPENEAVVAARSRVRVAFESRRAEEARRHAADLASARARSMFDAGEHLQAIRMLETFEHPPLVARLLQELTDQLHKIELRKREEDERRRKEEADARKREQERARLEDEKRRQYEQEQAQRRQEQELAARAKKELEDLRRRAKEDKERVAAEQLRLRQQEAEVEERRRRDQERAREQQIRDQQVARLKAKEARLKENEEARRQKERLKEEAKQQKQRSQEEARLAKLREREARQQSSHGVEPRSALWRYVAISVAALVAVAALVIAFWPRTGVITTPLAVSRLVVDATPWGEIMEVRDSTDKSLPLPPQKYTPLTLDVPPGRYRITLRGPDGTDQQVVDVEVKEDGGKALVPFQKIDPLEYFKKVGL